MFSHVSNEKIYSIIVKVEQCFLIYLLKRVISIDFYFVFAHRKFSFFVFGMLVSLIPHLRLSCVKLCSNHDNFFYFVDIHSIFDFVVCVWFSVLLRVFLVL